MNRVLREMHGELLYMASEDIEDRGRDMVNHIGL